MLLRLRLFALDLSFQGRIEDEAYDPAVEPSPNERYNIQRSKQIMNEMCYNNICN
jgi:hypothetical protein